MLFVVCYLLFVICYLLFVICRCCLLLAVCCLLFAVHLFVGASITHGFVVATRDFESLEDVKIAECYHDPSGVDPDAAIMYHKQRIIDAATVFTSSYNPLLPIIYLSISFSFCFCFSSSIYHLLTKLIGSQQSDETSNLPRHHETTITREHFNQGTHCSPPFSLFSLLYHF